MKFNFSTRTLALSSILISFLTLSILGFGSAFGNSSEIQGCVNKKSFVLRVSAKCTKDETRIKWNVAGLQGLPGEKGEPGDIGPAGGNGEKGESGEKGDAGIQGTPGTQGMKGDTGAQGIQGPPGPQGAQGIQGSPGPQGVKGDTGAQGIQGAQGLKGDNAASQVFKTRQANFIFWENVPIALSQDWGNGPQHQPITNYNSANCQNGILYWAGIPSMWEIDAKTQRIALSCVFSVLVP